MNKDEIFKNRLIEVRTLRGLSQGALAKKANLLPAVISFFETGQRKPSLDNLRKLANALNVSSDYLLGQTDKINSSSEEITNLFRDLKTDKDINEVKNFINFLKSKKDDQ